MVSTNSVYNLYGNFNTSLDILNIHWVTYASHPLPTSAPPSYFTEKIEIREWELTQISATSPPSLSIFKVNLVPIFCVIFPLVSFWLLPCQLSFSQVYLQPSPLHFFFPFGMEVSFILNQTSKKERKEENFSFCPILF